MIAENPRELAYLGLQLKAYVILNALIDGHAPTVLDQMMKVGTMESFAFYNGRECWAGLMVKINNRLGRTYIFTFGEDRRSDQLCLDCWIMERLLMNPPTVQDFPEMAYEQRRFFPADSARQVADVISSYLQELLDFGDLNFPVVVEKGVHQTVVDSPSKKLPAPIDDIPSANDIWLNG